jgi:hypothetical protein
MMKRLAILCLILLNMEVSAETKEAEAARKAVEAAVKQSGIDKEIEENLIEPLKKQLEPYIGKYLPLFSIGKVISEQKVEVKWEF